MGICINAKKHITIYIHIAGYIVIYNLGINMLYNVANTMNKIVVMIMYSLRLVKKLSLRLDLLCHICLIIHHINPFKLLAQKYLTKL